MTTEPTNRTGPIRSASPRRGAAVLLGCLVFGLASPAAKAQLAGVLPDRIVHAAGAISGEDRNLIRQYVEEHKSGLSGTPSEISEARKSLMRPLRDREATGSFRIEYAEALVAPVLRDLVKSQNADTAINATRILGELGTKSSLAEVLPILGTDREAVRLVAALGVSRSFDIIRESSQPALTQSDVTRAMQALADAFGREQSAYVADAIVEAFDAAVRIPEDKLPGVRADAARRLAGAIAGRIKSPEAAGFSHAFARAGDALLSGIIAVNDNLRLPESAVRESLGTCGDLVGWAIRRLSAGATAPGAERDELCNVARLAEKLYVYGYQKAVPSGEKPTPLNLDRHLACNGEGEPDAEAFRRAATQLIGPGGKLTSPPLGFSPDRFK